MNNTEPIPKEIAAGAPLYTGLFLEDYRELAELEHLYKKAKEKI